MLALATQEVQLDCKFEQVLQLLVQLTHCLLMPTYPAMQVPTQVLPSKFREMQAVQL